MDTGLPSELLTEQHRQIDQAIEGIVDGSGEPQALVAALKLLREHIYIEEEVLFPPLAAAGLTMPVTVMNREHGEMWHVIRRLEAACATAATISTLRRPATDLMRRLKVHNVKEEEVVYTAADRHQAAHPEASFAQAIATAQMPDDWICEMGTH